MSESRGEALARHRRLAILRLLDRLPGRKANDSVIRSALEELAFLVSGDRLRADFGWLEEQDLVSTETVRGVIVATLTSRGSDVAQDRAVHHGVARPGV